MPKLYARDNVRTGPTYLIAISEPAQQPIVYARLDASAGYCLS